MAEALMVLAVALLPALGIERVTLRNLRRVRDGWLWGLLAVGTVWELWREPWLGVIGLYLCWWWLQPARHDPLEREARQKLPTVLTWVGIAATWHLGLAMPAWAWPWLLTAWGVWAWLATGGMLWEVRHREWAKVRGGYGMRSITGAFLALVLPLLPLWAWPGPLVGLWLSGPSWLAVIAVATASLIRWPELWGIASVLLGCGMGLATARLLGRTSWAKRMSWNAQNAVRYVGRIYRRNQADMSVPAAEVPLEPLAGPLDNGPQQPAAPVVASKNRPHEALWGWDGWQPVIAGRRALEWTPRGDSLDSVRHRWLLLHLAAADWSPWLGIGPGVTNLRHMRAGCDRRHPLHATEMTGSLHNEPAQLAYEYGLTGVVAVLLFAWRVGSHLTLGDPWSAAAVAGVVLACGTVALRVAPIGLLFLLICARVVYGH